MTLDFSRCRDVWVPGVEGEGFWSPPLPHVRVGVQWIIEHPFALLADDMGGCKTAQALIAAQFLHDMDVIDRVIILAPAAIRPKVWFDQDLGQITEQAFNDKRIFVSDFHAKIKQWSRGPADAKELRIIVSNYEYIRKEANLLRLMPYCTLRTMLILDESSAVRGDSTQTDAVMRMRWLTNKNKRPILGMPRCGRVLEMNGTPVAESPMDLFTQGNILHPSILDCKYKTEYKARYAIQVPTLGSGGQVLMTPYPKRVPQPDGSVKLVAVPVTHIAGWSEEGLKDLQQRFAPYVLRREAKDFGVDFALPPVALEVVLTKETWKRYYVPMRDQMVAWLESGVVHAKHAGTKSIRLSQITSGFLGGVEDADIDDDFSDSLFDEPMPDYLRGRYEPDVNDPGGDAGDLMFSNETRKPIEPVVEIGREKLDFALGWHSEMLARHRDLKLLTWCRFVPELKRYLSEVRTLTPEVGAACGAKVIDDGRSKRAEREHALRLLHPKTAPAGPVTVGATQGTGAMGLNFTACRTVLDMSYDFSPWKKKQGDARVNRTGQKHMVSFFYLVAVGPKGQRTIDHHVLMHRTGKMNVNDLTTAGWVKMLQEE